MSSNRRRSYAIKMKRQEKENALVAQQNSEALAAQRKAELEARGKAILAPARKIKFAPVRQPKEEKRYCETCGHVLPGSKHGARVPQYSKTRGDEGYDAIAVYIDSADSRHVDMWVNAHQICEIVGIRYIPQCWGVMREALINAGCEFKDKIVRQGNTLRRVWWFPVSPDLYETLVQPER